MFRRQDRIAIELQELDDDQANIIKNILHDPISISGHYFEHMWFVNEQNVLYEGHITSVKCSSKSSIPKVTATYWKPGKSEGDDVTMTIFADFMTGDLYIDEIDFWITAKNASNKLLISQRILNQLLNQGMISQ